MGVTGIWQIESGCKSGVSGHDGIRKVPVHERAGPFQNVCREIGPVRQKAPHPLYMDVRATPREIQVPVGETQEQVTKARRIENVGVKQRRRPGHRLLQAEVLIEGRQSI